MDKFLMVLGNENSYLPGALWSQYEVEVLDDKMVCTSKKDSTATFEIPYTEFKSAEFGIGNGNLWLQCMLEKGEFVFCSPRKSWKSESAKKLIEKINAVTPISDMKSYNHFTGKLFFIYMFK